MNRTLRAGSEVTVECTRRWPHRDMVAKASLTLQQALKFSTGGLGAPLCHLYLRFDHVLIMIERP